MGSVRGPIRPGLRIRIGSGAVVRGHGELLLPQLRYVATRTLGPKHAML